MASLFPQRNGNGSELTRISHTFSEQIAALPTEIALLRPLKDVGIHRSEVIDFLESLLEVRVA
jgi:hypothetical protein